MVKELVGALSKLSGKHVTADVVGTISGLKFYEEFECWNESNMIVFSDETEEKYDYIQMSAIEDFDFEEFGDLMQLEIMLTDGTIMLVYNC